MESAPAEQMMANLNGMIDAGSMAGKEFTQGGKTFKVAKMDNFSYTDPIDKSFSKNQVLTNSALLSMW